MVDCVYYEEMNINKEAIKNRFNAKFGKEYNLHRDIADEEYIITADDIVNITPEIYSEILMGTYNKVLTSSNNCPEYAYKRYYNSLSLLAMVHEGNCVSKIEEMEGHPRIIKVRIYLSEINN